jgi:hypothetical protein
MKRLKKPARFMRHIGFFCRLYAGLFCRPAQLQPAHASANPFKYHNFQNWQENCLIYQQLILKGDYQL